LGKIILVVAGFLVAYWILKGYGKKVQRDKPPPRDGGEEDMVRCAQCGVHLPQSESLTTRGMFFCSAEHQRQHMKPE